MMRGLLQSNRSVQSAGQSRWVQPVSGDPMIATLNEANGVARPAAGHPVQASLIIFELNDIQSGNSTIKG